MNDEDWEDDDDWVPRNSAGNQKTCNVIRGEITKFLRTNEMTQTRFLSDISCNANSYGRFMALKGVMNGIQNGVYWGAARFFERRKRSEAAEKKSNPSAFKRKRAEAADDAAKKKVKGEVLLAKLSAGAGSDSEPYAEGPIYDSCPEIRSKSTAFLKAGNMTQGAFLKEVGVAAKSFNDFMKVKAVPNSGPSDWRNHQAGAANHFYPKAYHFFEKMRLAEGKAKSPKRLTNEAALGPGALNESQKWMVEKGYLPEAGCALKHDDGKRWVFAGR